MCSFVVVDVLFFIKGLALLAQVVNLGIANVYKCRADSAAIDAFNVQGRFALLQNCCSELFKSI